MPKVNKSTLLNEFEDRISFFIDQTTVKNTKRSTTNLLKKFNDHCKEYVLDSNINVISDQKQLDSNLVRFFSYAKCADKEEYSVNSVLSAIVTFQCYITKKSTLKEINLHDKQQFSTLNTLLNGKIKWLSTKCKDTPWGLFNRVFFFNALFIALREGEHYFLKKDHFQKHQDEDKHVGEKRLGTYLRYIIIASGIDIFNHRITNQKGCKTTIQLLKSFGASDYECIAITRHKSQTGFQQYERSKNNIQINKLGDLSRMIILDANYNNLQDQVNLLLTKKAILTTSTATITQATSATPTFQTAKKILQ
ncbi:8514_t:CDS:2, partial [Cetraspora pellucida]